MGGRRKTALFRVGSRVKFDGHAIANWLDRRTLYASFGGRQIPFCLPKAATDLGCRELVRAVSEGQA
jgi:hypothetical protein